MNALVCFHQANRAWAAASDRQRGTGTNRVSPGAFPDGPSLSQLELNHNLYTEKTTGHPRLNTYSVLSNLDSCDIDITARARAEPLEPMLP